MTLYASINILSLLLLFFIETQIGLPAWKNWKFIYTPALESGPVFMETHGDDETELAPY